MCTEYAEKILLFLDFLNIHKRPNFQKTHCRHTDVLQGNHDQLLILA
jgi:hypothetical protein